MVVEGRSEGGSFKKERSTQGDVPKLYRGE